MSKKFTQIDGKVAGSPIISRVIRQLKPVSRAMDMTDSIEIGLPFSNKAGAK